MNTIFKPKSYVALKQGYNWRLLRKDLYAGIITGLITIPIVIAFAIASGVSPEKGLITAVIGGIAVSVFGGSRFQIGGPTAALIVIIYGILYNYGFEGLMISTIMAGLILIVFGMLRLGSVIKLIPHPLIIGYTSGIALLIFTYSLKDAFGLPVAKLPLSFSQTWMTYFSGFSQINYYSLIITLVTILIAVLGGRIFRKAQGYLVSAVLVTLAVSLLHLPVQTLQSVFGDLPGELNFQIPHPDLFEFGVFIQPALTIAILVAIQSLTSAVVADGMTSSSHRSNTELIAQGIANIFSPCFGGLPVSGAVVRTVTNIKNEARTPFAGIIHAVVVFLFLLFAIKWTGYIPLACLSGLLIVFAFNMGKWRSFVFILKGSKYDVLVLLTAFFPDQ